MAANCCARVFWMGCLPSGPQVIELPVIALLDGDYTFVFDYLGTPITFTYANESGNLLQVGVQGLNDEFTFQFNVIDPNGDPVTYTVGGVTYDCFSVQLHAAVVGEAYTPPPPVVCDPVTILDQNDNVLATVPAGGEYHVVVLDEINNEDPFDAPFEISNE